MMKKTLLFLALVLTAANLTAGITYAAACQANGVCVCTGACSKEDLDWVGGGHFAEIEEGYVY